jgi:hypothetical protein
MSVTSEHVGHALLALYGMTQLGLTEAQALWIAQEMVRSGDPVEPASALFYEYRRKARAVGY